MPRRMLRYQVVVNDQPQMFTLGATWAAPARVEASRTGFGSHEQHIVEFWMEGDPDGPHIDRTFQVLGHRPPAARGCPLEGDYRPHSRRARLAPVRGGLVIGNEHYEALRRDVRDMAAALTRILAEGPPTPADAHALQGQADEAREAFAWMHHCGVLNLGYWWPGAYCFGCRSDVEKATHVQAHYRLVPVEGLGDEGRG